MSGTGSVQQTGCTKKDMARCENQELAEEIESAATSSAISTTKRGTGSASTGVATDNATIFCHLPERTAICQAHVSFWSPVASWPSRIFRPSEFWKAVCLPGTPANDWIMQLCFFLIWYHKQMLDSWHHDRICAIFARIGQPLV